MCLMSEYQPGKYRPKNESVNRKPVEAEFQRSKAKSKEYIYLKERK